MSVVSNDYASESGHWYMPVTGEPAYEIVGANGKTRSTTLRDAKKLGYLLPSVTSVSRVLAAPALEQYKVKQGIMAALTLPRLENEGDAQFIARVLQDSKEEGKAAADRGTIGHGQVERRLLGKPVDPEWIPLVDAVMKTLDDHFGALSRWEPEKSFASPLGYGGKVDLHNRDARIVVDLKSKDGDLSDVQVYDEHAMQLAAYAMGLWGAPASVAANCFFSRTLPIAKIVVHTPEEHSRGWAMFRHCLELWFLQKNYRPQPKPLEAA